MKQQTLTNPPDTQADSTPANTQPAAHNTPYSAYGFLLLGILCIGFSAIFTKWAGVAGPVSGFYRVLIATVVLAPFAGAGARRTLRLGPALLGLTLLAGVW